MVFRAVVFDLFVALTDFDAEPAWSGRPIASIDELPGLLATS